MENNKSQQLPELNTTDITIERSPFVMSDEVTDLFCRGYNGQPPWYELYSPKQVQQKLERLPQNSQLYRLRIGDELAGMVLVADNLASDNRSRFIEEVVVSPSFQQSPYRIGSQLMQAVIIDALTDGISMLALQTDLRNIKAVNLYRKFGFIPDERISREKPLTRTFALQLVSPLPQETPRTLSTVALPEGQKNFSNQKELQRYFLWQWLKTMQDSSSPDIPDDLNKYQSTLQPFIAEALLKNFLTKNAYDNFSIISGTETMLARLAGLAGFLLSLQSFSPNKISSKDMDKIVAACFDAITPEGKGEKADFVAFLCASYEEGFAAVSQSAQTNRLRFIGDKVKQLEQQLRNTNANIKLTFLFADTDYDIYPIEPNEENIKNYQRQYAELRSYCDENFGNGRVRILPWSRYRSLYKKMYQQQLEQALPQAIRRTRNIPGLDADRQQQRAQQQADYAAQAASLPNGNIILLALEDTQFNSDYDLLKKFPKIAVLNIDNYRDWLKKGK